MTTYYVGPGGNNSNDGTTWTLRKLTLNGAEDIPVAAADTVYVGPGVYRETLTVDVSGTAGNIITYIGDVTGQNTDGVGGTVRITGSDNDTTATRTNCITATSKNYRTFRGFSCDITSSDIVNLTSCQNIIIEDCRFEIFATSDCIDVNGADQLNTTIRRCTFQVQYSSYGVYFQNAALIDNTNGVVENCIFEGGRNIGILRVGNVTIRHCLISRGVIGILVASPTLNAGQSVVINNCIFYSLSTGMQGTATSDITENYNCIAVVSTPRTNTNTGANSVTYPPLFVYPALPSVQQSVPFASLSQWSPLRAIAGTGMATDDLLGVTRPTTDSKKSWGAVQYQHISRDTATKRTGAASIKLADAARHQMFVPTDGTEITIAAYAYWEADYAGDKPQLIVKQPGQSDSTDTATGAAEAWEQLTLTLTPAASPAYVIVELVSRNTATSGSYGTYFDDLTVT